MKRLIRAEDEKELFLQECREKNFSMIQMEQIKDGFDEGLSIEDVKFYAKKRYRNIKMKLFKNCLLNNISKNDILQYFDKDFDNQQISQIIWGIRNLPLEKLKIYLDPEFDSEQMYRIRQGLEDLSIEQVKIYAKKDFSSAQMYEIYWGFKAYNLSIDQVELFANPEYDSDLMHEIARAINGLQNNNEKLDFYFDCLESDNFDSNQLRQIRQGLKDLSIDQVKLFAKPEYDAQTMVDIKVAIRNLAPEKFNYYFDLLHSNNFSAIQMNEIKSGLQNLDIEQVKIYAKSEYNNHLMYIIRRDLEQNISERKINLFLDIYKENRNFNSGELSMINNDILEDLDLYLIKFYIEQDYYKMLAINRIIRRLNSNGKFNNLNGNEINKIFNPNFNYEQKLIILKGFEYNLPIKEIFNYADINLSANEMEKRLYNYFSNSDNFKDDENNFENDE